MTAKLNMWETARLLLEGIRDVLNLSRAVEAESEETHDVFQRREGEDGGGESV